MTYNGVVDKSVTSFDKYSSTDVQDFPLYVMSVTVCLQMAHCSSVARLEQ